MPDKKPQTPADGGTNPLLPAGKPAKRVFEPKQSRLPKGLKLRPGGGKSGKPPRFPGRAGGR